MALGVFDGYDHYDTHVDLAARSGFLQYQEASANPAVLSFPVGRNGYGKSLNFGAGANESEFSFVFGQRVASAFVGMGAFIGSSTTATGVLFRFYDSIGSMVTPQVTVYFNENNYSIQIYRGNTTGTLLYSSPNNVWSRNVWGFVDIWPTIDNSTGSVKVYVKNVLKASITGVDTQGTGNAQWDVMTVELTPTGASNLPTLTIDDFYYGDTTTGPGLHPLDVPLGDSKVQTLFMTGNDSVQFTPLAGANWQEISEVAMDSDTSYNFDSTAGHQDTFVPQPLQSGLVTIYGIQLTYAARKDDAGARTMKSVLKVGGTGYFGVMNSLPDGTYSYFTDLWVLNPNTTLNWTTSDVNAAFPGYNLVS